MSNVIAFPKMYGKQVALLTESKMYVGELCESEEILGAPVIALNHAFVAPITARPGENEVVNLVSVHVRWDKVVAISPADHFQIHYSQPSDTEE